MTTTPEVETRPEPSSAHKWLVAAAVGFGMALVGCLFALAFLWPITTTDPHDIELGVAGPPQATATIEKSLSAQGDTFSVDKMTTREQAVQAIKDRDVSGAFVVGTQGVEVLTASAGGPQLTQLLTQMANGMQTQAAATGQQIAVKVTDVVPGGTASSASNLTMLPALIAGLTGSIVGFLIVKRPGRRIATLLTAAVTAGLAGSATLGPWFDVLQGNYWLQALGIAAGSLAVGSFITGLASLVGRGGLAVGALVIMLFGNPWGGFLAPTEFLATPWGTIGSYLPNYNVLNLLKTVSFFPDASTGRYWLVLGIWIVCGLVMLWIGSALHRRKHPEVA